MPAPYGDGLYTIEPPSGNGLDITSLFHIVAKKSYDPDINSVVDSKYPNVAIITFDKTNQFGGMWAKEQLDLTMPFSTEMYLHLGRKFGSNIDIADGMTFTLHNDSAGIDAIGGAGEGLGVYKGRKWTGNYYQGNPETIEHGTFLRNSLVVEFDTYRNYSSQGAFVDDPPGGAHCSVIIPTNERIYQGDHNNNYFFNPSQDWVRFTANWTPNDTGGGTLSYTFGENIKDSILVLNTMATFKSNKVYWGFTGATGQYTAVQAVAITRLPEQGINVEKRVTNSSGTDINHGSALPGDILTYTIRATALPLTSPVGPVTIEDAISDLVEYVSDSTQIFTRTGGPFSASAFYNTDTGILSVSSTQYLTEEDDWVEISFKVKVKDEAIGKTIYNQATVRATGLPKTEDTNQTDVSIFAVPLKFVSDSSASGKGGSAVSAGDLITYEIEYANNTGTPSRIEITDTLNPGVDFIHASDNGLYDDATGTVTWVFTDVPDKTVSTVKLMVAVNESAVINIENRATVTVDDQQQETDPVINPIVPKKPVKKVSNISEMGKDESAVKSGNRITYEISFLNYTADAATITITDKLPIGVDYMASTPEGVFDDTTRIITWTLPDVPSTESRTVTLMVRVNSMAAFQIINYATVQVGTSEPQNTNIVVNPLLGARCPDIKLVSKCRTIIKGKKIWADNNNIGNTRPPTVEINLLRDEQLYQSVVVSSDDNAEYAFVCLPVWKNSNHKYVYRVDEATIPEGYRKTIDGYNIINTIL